LRILLLVDEVLVECFADELLGFRLHPRRHEAREVERGVPIEVHLVVDQAINDVGRHRLLLELVLWHGPIEVPHPMGKVSGVVVVRQLMEMNFFANHRLLLSTASAHAEHRAYRAPGAGDETLARFVKGLETNRDRRAGSPRGLAEVFVSAESRTSRVNERRPRRS
jgi:hypothetical protein